MTHDMRQCGDGAAADCCTTTRTPQAQALAGPTSSAAASLFGTLDQLKEEPDAERVLAHRGPVVDRRRRRRSGPGDHGAGVPTRCSFHRYAPSLAAVGDRMIFITWAGNRVAGVGQLTGASLLGWPSSEPTAASLE